MLNQRLERGSKWSLSSPSTLFCPFCPLRSHFTGLWPTSKSYSPSLQYFYSPLCSYAEAKLLAIFYDSVLRPKPQYDHEDDESIDSWETKAQTRSEGTPEK